MRKLNPDKIKQIHELHDKEGYTQMRIALELGISLMTVNRYLNNREQITLRDYNRDCRYKLTPEQIADIERRAANGETKSDLAREYGVSNSAISYYTIPGRKEKVNETSKELRLQKLKNPDVRKKYSAMSNRAQKRRRDLLREVKKGEEV